MNARPSSHIWSSVFRNNGTPMTQDRDSTSAEHLKASVKEALGKLTGDARVEAEGRRQKRSGGNPKAAGTKAEDPVRD